MNDRDQQAEWHHHEMLLREQDVVAQRNKVNTRDPAPKNPSGKQCGETFREGDL